MRKINKIMETLEQIPGLKKEQIKRKEGIRIITVENPQQGLLVAKEILYKEVDDQTALYLSGGSTPKDLYRQLVDERKLEPKFVAMVDERSDGSNFEMIKKTGLVSYLLSRGVRFYPIIDKERSVVHPNGVVIGNNEYTNFDWAAEEYSKFMETDFLTSFERVGRSIAIMGLGVDGHTAGIAPVRYDFNPTYAWSSADPVGSFKDPKGTNEGGFGERITLTFKALAEMDLLILLVFGVEKKGALKKMFEEGWDEEEIPARFYVRPEIAEKTILITDQVI